MLLQKHPSDADLITTKMADSSYSTQALFFVFFFQRMFCSLYRVFLTELNSIRSYHDHQYSQCSPCLKLTKITSGDKESTEKVKFYLQERWSRSVAPKHQSSEAPYFFSWSQSPSYSSLATGFPSVFLTAHAMRSGPRSEVSVLENTVLLKDLCTQLCGRYHFFFEAPGSVW